MPEDLKSKKFTFILIIQSYNNNKKKVPLGLNLFKNYTLTDDTCLNKIPWGLPLSPANMQLEDDFMFTFFPTSQGTLKLRQLY